MAVVGAIAALITAVSGFFGLFKPDPQGGTSGPVIVSAPAPAPAAAPDDAVIYLTYTTNVACTPAIFVSIAGIEANPTVPRFPVPNVPLGTRDYAASGTIACDVGGECAVDGAGKINITDKASYAISWTRTADAVCTVTVTQ